MASEDPELRALMTQVAKGTANNSGLHRFQAVINDIAEELKLAADKASDISDRDEQPVEWDAVEAHQKPAGKSCHGEVSHKCCD